MLSVNGLTKAFGSGANKLQVLKGVDMDIKQGEMVALMGPSGSGKSTLLNIIGGLLAGDDGSITLGERTYGLRGPSNVVDVRRELVGWIFQDFHLLDNLTAIDNVAMALELSGMSSSEAEQAAAVALEKVGLGDRMHFIPDQLSGGQQQRVAIARAILFNAQILIMDEPTAALGPQETEQVGELIQALKRDGIGIFLISHDIHDVFDLADRVMVMKNGQTVGTARTEDVTKDEVLGMIILGKCPDGAIPGPGATKS